MLISSALIFEPKIVESKADDQDIRNIRSAVRKLVNLFPKLPRLADKFVVTILSSAL